MKLQGQIRVAGSDSNQCTGPAVLTCRVTHSRCSDQERACVCLCMHVCMEFKNCQNTTIASFFCNLYFYCPAIGVAEFCCSICKVTQPIIFLYNGNWHAAPSLIKPTSLTDKILLVKKPLVLVLYARPLLHLENPKNSSLCKHLNILCAQPNMFFPLSLKNYMR